jgi:hypothetical protein
MLVATLVVIGLAGLVLRRSRVPTATERDDPAVAGVTLGLG